MKRLALVLLLLAPIAPARAEATIDVDLGGDCQMSFSNPYVAIGFLRLMVGIGSADAWLTLVRRVEPEDWDTALHLVTNCGGWGQ